MTKFLHRLTHWVECHLLGIRPYESSYNWLLSKWTCKTCGKTNQEKSNRIRVEKL
jgi:hypothetical protein